MERLRMLAHRNPWAATGFGVAVASLVLGLLASVAFGVRERAAAAHAERALAQSERALWLSRLSEMSRAIESADAGVVGSLLVRLHDDTSWPMRLLRALADESLAVFHGTSHFETFSAMAGAISPDGTVLALAMDQGNGVTLLDSKSLKFLRSLEPGLAAWALTFTRPEQRLVVGHDRTLSVWERPWSGPPRDIRLPIEVGTGIACSPDGARVVVCGDGTACLVDLETGSVLAEAERFDGQTTRADWAPDGAFVAVSGATGTIRILDAATMQVRQVLTAPTLRVLAIAFDPTGRWLAAGGDMRVLRVFDMSSGQPTSRDLRMDFSIWGLDWNPDGRTLAVADRGSGVRLVDVPPDGGPLTLTGSFLGHRGEVWDIAWAPDAMGLYSIGQYEVHRWRARPLHKDRSIELGAPGLGLCRLPDGDLMAICADATLWRIRDRADATRPERVWHGGPFLATAVAGDPARDRWAWIDASGEPDGLFSGWSISCRHRQGQDGSDAHLRRKGRIAARSNLGAVGAWCGGPRMDRLEPARVRRLLRLPLVPPRRVGSLDPCVHDPWFLRVDAAHRRRISDRVRPFRHRHATVIAGRFGASGVHGTQRHGHVRSHLA
jgi:WD40 repeat protein